MKIESNALRVYVAGPISKGSESANVRKGIEVGTLVWDLGFAVYIPHLTHIWAMMFPHSYEEWMGQDFAWLSACNALLRIPGESPGADREEAFAREQGIPIFYEVIELAKWAEGQGMTVIHNAEKYDSIRELWSV